MTEPAVVLENLLFRWRENLPPCLDIPALRLDRGEKLFLQGGSGSGKSTLLSLVGGVVSAERGRVAVLGRDLAGLGAAGRDRHRAEHLGFVFQLFNLLPYLSARENIMLPCRFSPRRAARIAAAGSTPAREAERLAGHLDLEPDLLGRPAAELSVGQQQRVAAARALIGSPELIVADEPTSALDADRQRRFLQLLLRECAAAGSAILFVSHDMRLAPAFDRVVALADVNLAGRMAA